MCNTYRAHRGGTEDAIILSNVRLHLRKLFGIQDLSLSDEADAAVRQGDVVRCRQLLVQLQRVVQLLSHSRVCTVCTNEDIAMVGGVVRALDKDTRIVL